MTVDLVANVTGAFFDCGCRTVKDVGTGDIADVVERVVGQRDVMTPSSAR